MIDEWIKNTVIEALNLVSNLTTTTAISNFNEGVYSACLAINTYAIKPVSSVVLALFFMLELYNVVIRTDLNGIRGVEIPFKTMFKIAVCKMMIDSSSDIMKGIYDAMNGIMINANSISFASSTADLGVDSVEGAVSAILGGMPELMIIACQVLIITLLISATSIIVQLILVGRMIEIYVYLAVAPLPMVTLANQDQSSIGKNFLKSFVAVCLQGTLIVIVIKLFGALMGSIDASSLGVATISGLLWRAAGYCLLLIIALFSCGKWAKSICNAV